ncbi:type II toxin-antitoxin system RelE/ParE family toxin [Paraburkholderia sp. A2RI-6]|uniref:type II toxin-antitoxin system RelE/ParE family toxin n=1 Tax=unclassified Paraburkholderia TaxID=2615204 RepID=UPI003B81144B
MKVVFLQSARTDLQQLRRYLVTRFGGQVWREALARMKRDVAQLESFPQKGSIPPELDELGTPNYRQVVSGMCRIIYEIDDQTVNIHLVVDIRRDLKDVLANRLLRP